MRVHLRASICSVLLALCACDPSESAKSYGDPTSLKQPSESGGIVAWVEQPATRSVGSSALEIVLGAYTEGEDEPLAVSLGRLERDAQGNVQTVGVQQAVGNGAEGAAQRFTVTMNLNHGVNQLVARLETADQGKVRTLSFNLSYDGLSPGVSMSARSAENEGDDPCTEGAELKRPITNRRTVCIHGLVTTPGTTVAGAELSLVGGTLRAVELSETGAFAVPFELPGDQECELNLTVNDQRGGRTRATFTVVSDQTPPVVRITTTASETSLASIELAGTAEDAHGIDQVRFEGESGSTRALGRASPFQTVVQLSPGSNELGIVARDLAGNEARTAITMSRVRILTLRGPRANVGTTAIEMDRQDLGELLSEDDQRSIEVVAIELADSVKQTLERIRFPERYGVDTSQWADAEWNMQRILRMTPDVADLTGTSMEELLDIAAAVGLPPPRMLAELLDMAPTDFILDLDVATEVIIDKLIGSHPNITRDASGTPVLSVSMFDVLNDLTSLAARFGPSGEHPGFLSGESRSTVLEPGFLLTLPVSSNLVQYDAVDLARAAKDYLFLLEGERVLDFNVLTDEFEVVGLKDEPSIDLQFIMTEAPTFTRAGNDRTAAPDALDPGFFRGNGASFAVEPWLFEHIACEIGYRQQHRLSPATDFQRTLRYDAGSIEDAAVIDWNRGWVNIQTAGNLGTPPPPLYAWDLLSEVAQVRLHDQGVAEGNARMVFAIDGLPIGLTADELIEKLRPKLHEQEDKLSEILVGDTGLATSRADFYYVPGEGGDGALLFRNETDAGGGVSYARPGFYEDVGMTRKVSVLGPAFGVADETHEKVSAQQGAVYFAEDEDGLVYQVTVSGRTAEGIQLEVRATAGGPL